MDLLQPLLNREQHGLEGSDIYLGLLRSYEYSHLDKGRRNTLKIFWTGYFKSMCGRPRFALDGTQFLEVVDAQ